MSDPSTPLSVEQAKHNLIAFVDPVDGVTAQRVLMAIDALIAAVRAASLPPGWQPIETAPKDEPVLGLYTSPPHDQEFQEVVRFSTGRGVWIEANCFDERQAGEVIVPTRWMPLPAASLPSRQALLIEAAAAITTLRREADYLDAYAAVPCQSENAWHARDYRRWASLIENLASDRDAAPPPPISR